MLVTVSAVEILGPTEASANFFHLDILAIGGQTGSKGLGKFTVLIGGDETPALLAVTASGGPIAGGNALVGLPCPKFCQPPATPGNPLVAL